MQIPHWLQKLGSGLNASVRRFPVPIAIAAAISVLLIVRIEMDYRDTVANIKELARVIMMLGMGFPLFLCLKLWFERRQNAGTGWQIIAHLLAALMLILYGLFFLKSLDWVSVTRYTAIFIALCLGFVVLPYGMKRENFELHVLRLVLRFLMTVVFSGVLYAGIAIILFSVDRLLEIAVNWRMYLHTFLLIAGWFAPAFFLAAVPLPDERLDRRDYPRALEVLLLYIVLPLITAYTAILYIYLGRIIITSVWPEGIVSHLVLWYSAVSLGVIMAITPLRPERKWARFFIFWFPKIILPLLVMMFISLGIRINAYGFTENRYFALVLGLWVLAMMIRLSLVSVRRNIIIPLTLAIVAFLSVAGPWSAYSVSKFSQNNRLETLLDKYGMIRQGEIVHAAEPVERADQVEISQILYYFDKRHDLDDVRYLPDDFTLNRMSQVFGFAFVPPHEAVIPGNRENERYFSLTTEVGMKPLDISGYQYMFRLSASPAGTVRAEGWSIDLATGTETIWLKIERDGRTLYENNLNELVKAALAYEEEHPSEMIPLDLATFTDSNGQADIKVLLDSAHGSVQEQSGRMIVRGIELYLLVNHE